MHEDAYGFTCLSDGDAEGFSHDRQWGIIGWSKAWRIIVILQPYGNLGKIKSVIEASGFARSIIFLSRDSLVQSICERSK